MGICQTHPPLIEPQIALSQSNQVMRQSVKQSKHEVSKQTASPVKQLPNLPKPVTQRLDQLGAFNYEKCQKYSSGKQMGPHKFHNGTVYLGEWYNGQPHGRGKYYLPDNSYFQGISVQGQIQGFGRIIHPNGDYYEGQLKSGQANGKGTYIEGNNTYEGYFKDNLQHGIGYEHNELYEFKGEFVEGQKKRGKLAFKNKKYQYDGQFKYNKFHGNGILIVENQRYEGQFLKGLKSGNGKLTHQDKSFYEGQFKSDQKHGLGKVYDKNKKLIREQKWENGTLVK